MGERVVGLEGQLKRWMVVSSDKEQWGQEGEGYFSGSILCYNCFSPKICNAGTVLSKYI